MATMVNFRSKATAFFLLAAGLSVTNASHAALYQLDIKAEIREISVSGNGDPGAQPILDEFGLSVGATISTTYIIDGSVPANVITDFGVTTYYYAALLAGGVTLPSGLTTSYEPGLPFAYAARVSQELLPSASVALTARTQADSSLGPIDLRMSAQLFDAEGLALTSPALDPSVFLDLTPWDPFEEGQRTGFFFSFSTPDITSIAIAAEYTNVSLRVIPLPGALWLLASSLLVGSAVARSRQ